MATQTNWKPTSGEVFDKAHTALAFSEGKFLGAGMDVLTRTDYPKAFAESFIKP
jgi:hypothetical protein